MSKFRKYVTFKRVVIGAAAAYGIFGFLKYRKIKAIRREIPSNMLLHIPLDISYVDGPSDKPNFFSAFNTKALTFNNLIDSITLAGDDPRVNGLLLRLNPNTDNMPLIQLEYLRDTISEYKQATNKKTIAYINGAINHRSYYLASVCDKISMQQNGVFLDFSGISHATLFMKRLLKSLYINPQVVACSDYKAAPNIFTEKDYTDGHKANIDTILEGYSNIFSESVAKSRNLGSSEEIKKMIKAKSIPLTNEEALQQGFIDAISSTTDTLNKELQNRNNPSNPYKVMSIKEYYKRSMHNNPNNVVVTPPHIIITDIQGKRIKPTNTTYSIDPATNTVIKTLPSLTNTSNANNTSNTNTSNAPNANTTTPNSNAKNDNSVPLVFRKKIAVVYLRGNILPGRGPLSSSTCHELPVSKLLRELSEQDKGLSGLILRIDSPGGDAGASAEIHNAIRNFSAKTGRPVIASMGQYAASGGYMLASAADVIFAHKLSLTGSIGVFVLKFSVNEALEKLGIDVKYINKSDQPPFMNAFEQWDENDLKYVEKFITMEYNHFLKMVNERRKIPMEELKLIAQGKVWTGLDAKNLKLVDEIGGTKEAIQKLIIKSSEEIFNKEITKLIENKNERNIIVEWKIEEYPKRENPFEKEFKKSNEDNDPYDEDPQIPGFFDLTQGLASWVERVWNFLGTKYRNGQKPQIKMEIDEDDYYS